MIVFVIIAAWFLLGIGVYLGVKRGIHDADDDLLKSGDYKLICRSCFERIYDNQWLGFRMRTGECSVCHRVKRVDARPINQLTRKDSI
jgi:hypothetical protein